MIKIVFSLALSAMALLGVAVLILSIAFLIDLWTSNKNNFKEPKEPPLDYSGRVLYDENGHTVDLAKRRESEHANSN